MSITLRKIIENQLYKANGEVSNIIFNSIQKKEMVYDIGQDNFKIRMFYLDTKYFFEHPYETMGKIKNTDVYWKVQSGKFIVWLDI